jgi:hypothetical protein
VNPVEKAGAACFPDAVAVEKIIFQSPQKPACPEPSRVSEGGLVSGDETSPCGCAVPDIGAWAWGSGSGVDVKDVRSPANGSQTTA